MMLRTFSIREELLNNFRAAFARMWVRLRGSNRDPLALVAEIGLPILSIGAYVILYRAIGLPATAGAAVIIGGAMIAFWTNVLWNMSSQWFWEREQGNLEMYLVAPVSIMAIFVFQVPFVVRDPLAVGLVFFLTLAALYTLGMLFASLFMLYGREAWNTANLLQEPFYFLSGAYFPAFYGVVPFAIAVAGSLIPMTLGLDAIRRLVIVGGDLNSVWLEIVALVASILILFPLARRTLNYMESLGKKEGRLTLRWQ